MKIFVSGLYCGTNPQPGVGISRSLRQAFPDARIVGVEYSTRSSGIHWQEFDSIWLQRPWEEMDLPDYAEQIKDELERGALWISGTDLETMWLASIFPGGHKNLLSPSTAALEQVAKPLVPAHEGLPVKIPPFVLAENSDWDLHAFCRAHGWKTWLKGPYYEALRVRSWADFEAARTALTRAWATDRLFLQAHVTGYEESVMLAAYKGELLECVSMRKRELTEESKTWAGNVTAVPEEIAIPLREIIKKLDYTGGAELEMVRDANEQLWLLEWNPRFPAWVHGATIAGKNLPAVLVEAATGVKARKNNDVSEQFTRVVLEIPTRPNFPLSTLPEPFAGAGFSLKHPSGLTNLAEKLHKLKNGGDEDAEQTEESNQKSAPVVPQSFVADLSGFEFAEIQTPSSLFLENTAASLFKKAAGIAGKLSDSNVKVANGYSIKTDPDKRLIKLALDSGFYAEAISPLEVRTALEVGFKPEQIILNGPGKWWLKEYLPSAPMHAIFADSMADLKRTVAALANRKLAAKIIGVRLRTPNVNSRFGIPIGSPDDFKTLINAIEELPQTAAFGVHFHMASSAIGVEQWWHLFESMLRWCRSIERLTNRKIECLDVGGGWFPDDWNASDDDRFATAIAMAREALPHVREIVSEPGKALSQPSSALAMRILEVYEAEGKIKEAVVDASIAELPMYFFYPHRVLMQNRQTKQWQPLRRGKTSLLGRLCMEHDVVGTNLELPADAEAGDVLVFCDAGAYDRSMSYVFGQGS